MNKEQRRKMNYNIQTHILANRIRVVEALGLMEDFRNSEYSSYGWYLKSLGITVEYTLLKVEKNSPYFNDPRLVELEVSFGRYVK